MANLLVVSHGAFAEGLRHSVEMIIGKNNSLFTCSLEEDAGVGKFEQDFSEMVRQLSRSREKLVILCDLYYGCPNVKAAELAATLLTPETYKIITGANMPMMLELCLANQANPDDLDFLVKSALTNGKEGIQEFVIKTSKAKDQDVL